MKNSLVLIMAIVFFLSVNADAANVSTRAPGVYTDGQIEFILPENTVPIAIQKCGRDTVARVPTALTNFRCTKALHNNKEYLILENTASNRKQQWRYKIMVAGDRITELGDLNLKT